MMTLTTYIACHADQNDEQVLQSANKLRDTIRCFATNVSRDAFWDAESAMAQNCIVVYGGYTMLENAMQIKCDDIDEVIAQWCKDIADHLHDLSNDLVEGFNVEIEDLELFGGLHITCADQDNKEPYELWILPIKKGEQE